MSSSELPELSSASGSVSGSSGSFSASAEIPIPAFVDLPDTEFVPQSDSSSESLEHHEGSSSSASDKAGHPEPEEEAKDLEQLSAYTQFEKSVFESVKNHSEFTALKAIENFHAYLKKNLGKDHLEDVFEQDGSPDRDGNVYGTWKKGSRVVPGIPLMPWREVDQEEALYAAFDMIQKVFYKPPTEKKRKVQRRSVKETTKAKTKSKK